ncbi:hypothetical protein DL770_007819 [Monosporascus sp. CRB-9-2]|nr:hypothetical protein DL770_007819 [Monosporascus sp. CRB-9-2]
MDFGTRDGGFTWEEDPVKRREVAKKILPAFSTKAIRAKQATVHMSLTSPLVRSRRSAARQKASKSLRFPLPSPLTLLFTLPKLLKLLSKFSKLNGENVQKRIDNRGVTKQPDFPDHIPPANSPVPTSKKQKVPLSLFSCS